MKKNKFLLALCDESLFRYCYLSSFFFYMISYVTNVAIILIGLTTVWGVALSIRSIVKNKAYLKIYYGFWLFAFLVSLSCTFLFNLGGGFLAVGYNFVLILHTLVCFVMFYGVHINRGSMYRWEMYLFFRFFVYAATVTAFIGLTLLLFGSDLALYGGVTFTGVFFNPNYQGFVSALALIFCHFFTKPDFLAHARQKRISRIWLTACALLNLIALVLSNSNGSLLFIGIYAAFMILFRLLALSEKLTPKRIIIRIFALLAVGVLLAFLLMFVRAGFKLALAAISSDGDITKEQINDITKGSFFNIITDTGLSSRLELWGAGFTALLKNPVFGVGKGSLYDYIIQFSGDKSYFTDDYLSNVFIADMHNGYIGIIVVAGILGAVLFGMFLVRFLKMTMPVWFIQRQIMTYSVYPCLIALFWAYMIYAFIERTILFDLSFIVLTFWVIIGYMACYATDLGYCIRGTRFIFNRKLPNRLF